MYSIFMLLLLLKLLTISYQNNLRHHHQQDLTYLGSAVTFRYPMHMFNCNDTHYLRNTSIYNKEIYFYINWHYRNDKRK